MEERTDAKKIINKTNFRQSLKSAIHISSNDSIFQTPELSDDQPMLETVTSVDQLLQLLYPEYSLLQHCLRKKSWRLSSAFPSFPDSSASAFHPTDDDLWGQPREEPLYKMDGTLGGK